MRRACYFSSLANIAPAGFRSPRSLRISMRFSASSIRVWQKRDSCTPRSYSSSDFSSARSPSSSFLTIVSSSAMAASKSLIVESISFHHFTFQLALRQRHAHAVACLHFRRLSNDARSRLIPHNGITAAENCERAEAVEPRGAGMQSRFGAMAAMNGGRAQRAVHADEPRTYRSQAPAHVVLLQLHP